MSARNQPPDAVLDVLRVHLGPRVTAAFTSRIGGASIGPYHGLNLSDRVGDDPAAVLGNRARLAGWLGAPVAFPHQVHGRAVLVLDQNGLLSRMDSDAGTANVPDRIDLSGAPADAVVAVGAGPAVGVLVADCVPVLLADPEAGVVAAAHAGRRGLVAGVLTAVVAAMLDRGAAADRIRAAIGPAAGPCCYEVPAAMRDEVAGSHPATRSLTRRGTPSLDLRAGCAEELGRLGVRRISTHGGCTIEDPHRYSYRRAATTGRFAGVVRLVP